MTASIPLLAQFKPNPHWAKLPLFNRKNWSRVRFDDVVDNLNETCDPAEAGLDRVIAMEHLEPGSLHVRAWGNVADGTTFTRRCRPGQVLFGKRRAYQRKVAVAEFDAVVSGDIYVLAPMGDRLLPELLPFLCLSERFFQHAVGTSAGSLSPRTNWSSLASFEFDLPPLDQQRRIAEIIWAVDETRNAWKATEAATLTARETQINYFRQKSKIKVSCAELVTLASGKSKPKDISERADSEKSVPVYGGNGIIGYTEKPLLTETTIVVGRVGEYCGCVHFAEGKSWITDNAIYIKELDERVTLPFIYWMLRAANLNKKKKIAGQPLISQSTITEETIPLPSAKEQADFLADIDQLTDASEASANHYKASSLLLDALTNSFCQP